MNKTTLLAAALALSLPLLAGAQEAVIRKNLGARVGMNEISEVSKTPMSGLYEVRIGNDVLYTDAKGDFLIQGSLVDTQARKNLTEERVNKLTAVDFASLPFDNAFTTTRGSGKRKLAVFMDPNCGYCKRFEKDLQKVDDIIVYTFLIPVLGEDSALKSRQIWCSDDKVKTWLDWMLENVAPKGNAVCNTEALTANMEFAKKHHITGTPTLLFADGTRVPGAINTQQLEQKLAR